MKPFTAVGDSITEGTGASPSTLSWYGLLQSIKISAAGNQAAEVSKSVQAGDPDTNRNYVVMIGTNDHRQYKNDASKQEYFKRFLRQTVSWLALPTKVKGRDAGMTYTGSWTNTTVNSFGKYSTSNGATAQATVSGDSVYIGYIIQNSANAKGVVNVEIDNVLVGTLETDGSSPSMNTVNGSTYAAACQRFSGLGAGNHTVKLTLTSAAGKYFYVDYIAGSDQAASPKVAVSDIIKMSAAAYTTYGTNDTNVDTFNGIISDLVDDFVADGFDVSMIANHAAIDPTTDLAADGVHPNNAGHAIISDNNAAAL